MKILTLSILFGLSVTALQANAGSQYHRLIWDANPQTEATIGFTPSSSNNHYLKYGFSTNEQNWTSKAITSSHTFAGSLQSRFIKLSGLNSDSAVYYRICDDSGCGERLWFKTAPTDSTPFTAIAGGDTRTGWTNRQNGNRLVAKIRPLFIMHGGDYTNANSASEMKSYLADWQLTLSDDTIDGFSYKRIYPFIPTHGNHEDNNFKTLCEVFGADYDSNGVCDAKDTYGAITVSPLLRVYTLNSQFQNSGWSSYATVMNNWLSQDLTSQGSSVSWRVAQYHKPMYPHYSGKSDNLTLVNWWSSMFYNKKMNLVVESDTHINKVTEALEPNGTNFNATTNGGTVYVGEGSWGAPARSANDPKSWTIDLASIQQFKVFSVTAAKLSVRTAQFSASASTLSRSQRTADPLALPSNVDWWAANSIGEELALIRASNGLTVIDNGGGTDPVDPPAEGALEKGVVRTSLSGAKGASLNFTFDAPADAENLNFTMSGGTGDADLYVKFGSLPTSSSYDCRPYKNGNNETCSFATPQVGTYYVMLTGYSSFSGVSLTADHTTGGNTPPVGGGDSFGNLNATKGNWYRDDVNLPEGASKLTVSITGGSGDADLYLRHGTAPSSSTYDCRPYKNGNVEECVINNPQSGTWHFGLYGYASFSGVTMSYQYE
jgi:hypothetical protein